MIKNILKNILGYLQCRRFKIKSHGKNIYIGLGTKIIGGNNICIGSHVQIRRGTFIACNKKAKIIISDGCDIGERSRLCAASRIEIGKNVLMGPNVFITDHDHAYTDIKKSIQEQGIVKKNIVEIGMDSFVGINSVIMGHSLGKHSVIGANSFVTENFGNFCVVVGNPAKMIKYYDFTDKIWTKNDQ